MHRPSHRSLPWKSAETGSFLEPTQEQEVVRMGQPVVHWEITARDASRLENFYHELFDWSVRADRPIAFRQAVDTGSGEGISGSIAESGGSWPSGAMFYVQVDDVREYLRRAERLGGSTLLPATEMEGERTIGIFRDPEGVTIGLIQR